MSTVLKGNFQASKTVTVAPSSEDDLETRFEREAMKRLGGSIAFVAKKKVVWDLDGAEPAVEAGK